jgi:hypothetical protein
MILVWLDDLVMLHCVHHHAVRSHLAVLVESKRQCRLMLSSLSLLSCTNGMCHILQMAC